MLVHETGKSKPAMEHLQSSVRPGGVILLLFGVGLQLSPEKELFPDHGSLTTYIENGKDIAYVIARGMCLLARCAP